jgi:hypothetical protein
MSIALELEGDGKKLGRVCDRDYRNGPNCPLVLRESSEDLLTANVFGVLRHLRPSMWMVPLLRAAFPRHRFGDCTPKEMKVALWKKFSPPMERLGSEGPTEVDVHLCFRDTVVFVEAKYRSALSMVTKHDDTRDQVIRLLDVAYANLVDSQFFPLSPYVLVLGAWPNEPSLVTEYRDAEAVRNAIPELKQRPDGADIARFLADRVGYQSWAQLAKILTQRLEYASRMESAFALDVAGYLRHRASLSRLTGPGVRS